MATSSGTSGSTSASPSSRSAIFGFLLVIMMVLRPEGLLPERRRKMELHRGHRRRPRPSSRRADERERRDPAHGRASPRSSAAWWRSTTSRSTSRRGRSSRSSARTAPARRPSSTCSPGLYKPTAGPDRVRRRRTSRARRPDQITSLGVARTFQNIRLFGTMTAIENVMVGQHARMKAGLFGSILRPPSVRREEVEVRRRRARCSTYVGPIERTCTSRWPRTSPTATSAASRSPARSRPSPSCCCSTSRRPA